MSGPIVPPLEVTEVDGSPDGRPITKLVVSSGDLTISGRTATIDTSGSGGVPATPADAIQFNSDPAGTFTSDAGFTMGVIGGGNSTTILVGGMKFGAMGYGVAADTVDGNVSVLAEGAGQIILSGSEDAGGTFSDLIVKVQCWELADEAVIQFTNQSGVFKQTTLTLDANSDFIINNEIGNADIDIKVGGTGIVEVQNSTTDQASTLSVRGNGTGDSIIQLTNDSKSVSLKCDVNQKLKIDGGTQTFVFDASSASGGMTFPDGTELVSAEGTAILATGVTDGYVLTADGADAAAWEAAGGGGGGNPAGPLGPDPANVYDGSYYALTAVQAGWGAAGATSSWIGGYPAYFPFISLKSGDLASISVYVSTTATGGTAAFGIYSDSDGMPDSLLGFATISTAATGIITQTSLSSTITLTRGSQFWVGMTTSAGSAAYVSGVPEARGSANCSPRLGINSGLNSTSNNCLVVDGFGSSTSLPATITGSTLAVFGRNTPIVGLKW